MLVNTLTNTWRLELPLDLENGGRCMVMHADQASTGRAAAFYADYEMGLMLLLFDDLAHEDWNAVKRALKRKTNG